MPSTTIYKSIFQVLITMMAVSLTGALAAAATTPKKVVLVSGAGGQTGQALFRKLLAVPEEFQPLGLVRSEASKKQLVDSGVPDSNVVVADVTNAEEVQAAVQLAAGGGDNRLYAFCICTSAKPAPTGETDPDTGRPVFGFPNGDPEMVDWIGQKNQIDACPPGAHVVLCSTMGGTNPDHPLNNLGKKTNPEDGSISGGMIVQWKRKSEVYLIGQAPKLKYTIIHPGGLTNEPGGERELVVGVDDCMDGTTSRTVPRDDVAQVMMEALRYPEHYAGRSFDLRAKDKVDGTTSSSTGTDFSRLLDQLETKNCDYSLGATM